LLAILAIQYYPLLHRLGLQRPDWLHKWGITPGLASFAIVLIWGTYAILRARSSELSPRSIAKFESLIEEVESTGGYAELFSLIEPHMERLIAISKQNLKMDLVRRRLEGPSPNDLFRSVYEPDDWDSGDSELAITRSRTRIVDWVAKRVASFLPSNKPFASD